ncbi:hypothetical protein [Saccharomonospora amisosensis]|uniref:hypothetical protein n=1 Tax=Saccharomonospora amisosensis TaxID=1128677 RepID=UPI00141DD017|nr:hypothetical protein [Saccharomonospora amisosensis]
MESDAAVRPSQPVDFPVYGVGAGFRAVRWVDFFEGAPDTPPWALWLGHRDEEGESGVRVGTLPRKRYEQTMCPGGGDPVAEVAHSGALGLVNLTLPDTSVPRPDGLIVALVEHAERQAKRYREWPLVWWDIDGAWVRARVWHFAGAWTGFTEALADTYVVAIGVGVESRGLSLARVTDLTAYGTDLRAPLSLIELGRHKSTQPKAWIPPPTRGAFHPDQLALTPKAD